MSSTRHIQSADGSLIAVTRDGEGPPVILVGGAFNDATTVAGLAGVLSPAFETFVYDRRGRGKSTDERAAGGDPVQAEVDDLAAIAAAAGGPALVFGHSSGAILALEAAARGVPMARLAVYEPPYVIPGTRPQPPTDLRDRLTGLLDAGDRGAAAALFLTECAAVPPQAVEQMRDSPVWPWFTGLADSLPYDAAVTGPGATLPAARLASIGLPVLVVSGGGTEPWLTAAAAEVAAAIPDARPAILDGHDHSVLQRPEALALMLSGFFATDS